MADIRTLTLINALLQGLAPDTAMRERGLQQQAQQEAIRERLRQQLEQEQLSGLEQQFTTQQEAAQQQMMRAALGQALSGAQTTGLPGVSLAAPISGVSPQARLAPGAVSVPPTPQKRFRPTRRRLTDEEIITEELRPSGRTEEISRAQRFRPRPTKAEKPKKLTGKQRAQIRKDIASLRKRLSRLLTPVFREEEEVFETFTGEPTAESVLTRVRQSEEAKQEEIQSVRDAIEELQRQLRGEAPLQRQTKAQTVDASTELTPEEAQRARQIRKEFLEDFGREPTPEEILRELGI